MDVFSLFAKIGLDTSEYERGLDDASGKTHSFGEKLKSGLATAAKVGAAAITAVTAATTAMSAAFAKGVSDTAAYGDNIDKMSQKMGMSAEAYQEWDAVMQHSGTSIESLQAGMKTLANAVENGNGAFERLGITQEQIASMNNEELFSATITALQNVENETERTYLAGQLLGRGATELGALLNTSAEDTQAMKDRVHELGGVMSDEAVKAAAAYQDSLQDMKTAFSGLSRGMTGEFLPSVTTVMDGLTEIFSGNRDTGIGIVTQGVSAFMRRLQETMPKVLEIGSRIVSALSGVIMENLPSILNTGTEIITNLLLGIVSYIPQLATAAVDIIKQIATSIAENLPLLLTAALDTVLALANGISKSLPELIPTIVDVVIQIVETLIDNVDMLVDAAIEIIVALTEGLVQSIPILIQAIPRIISSLVSGFESFFPKIFNLGVQIINTVGNGIRSLASEALQWGRDMIDGFVQGIKDKISTVTNAVKSVANSVRSFLHFSRPDEGPLRDYETWMPDFMEGLAHGIDANAWRVEDALLDATSKMRMDIGTVGITGTAGVTPYQNSGVGRAASASGGDVFNITINGAKYSDEQTLARAVAEQIQYMTERRQAVYA